MLTDSLFIHLAQDALLLSYDSEQEIFSIRFGNAVSVSPALTPMLVVLGFERDCSCRWSCHASADAVSELLADLKPLLNGSAVWDAGKVFGTTGDWLTVTLPTAPEAWSGATAIRVCESGHAVVSDSSASEWDLRDMCRQIYRRYLVRDFHPCE